MIKEVIAKYRKSIVAALGAAITAFIAVYTDGVTTEEWTYILIQAGAAVGVWGVPNKVKKEESNATLS